VTALALDFDAVLGDTGPLLRRWEEGNGRRFDGDANRERLLERFAEEHAAAYLRRRPDANAALRRLAAAGVRVGAFTDSPAPLARVAAAQLGVDRHLDALECGSGALDRLLAQLGSDAVVVRSLAELTGAAA
jgi:FMN phosphatase YigB (HAD superfamily)